MLTESCVLLALNVSAAQVVEGGAAVTQLPFQKICDVDIKPSPESVNVKDGPPAITPSGESEVMIGVGIVVVPLPPQEINRRPAITAEQASAVRRKRINPSLL
jgi:hypothetical protein